MANKSVKRDLRLEMRVKNNLLWHAIHELHPNVASFCRKHGLCQTVVGKFISFKVSPFKKKGEYRFTALRISEALGIAPTELFPPGIYARMLKIGSFKAIEVDSFTALPRAARREIRLLPSSVEQGPEVACIDADWKEELEKSIESALKYLSYREREILKLLYGLFGQEAFSLDEVANIFKVTRDRIRQIEAKAVRKLQQPHRSQLLVGFLN